MPDLQRESGFNEKAQLNQLLKSDSGLSIAGAEIMARLKDEWIQPLKSKSSFYIRLIQVSEVTRCNRVSLY